MEAISPTETPRGDEQGSSSASAATGLLPGFLLEQVKNNHQVTKIAQTMVGILRLGCPLLTVPRGLALLHMLRQLIRLFPRLTAEELQNMRCSPSGVALVQRRSLKSCGRCQALLLGLREEECGQQLDDSVQMWMQRRPLEE